MDDDSGFVIFSGNKLWYSSKKKTEPTEPNKVIKNVNKVRNAAKNKRVVEFPIFDEILKRQTDSYWISFFDECAIGKLPRGFKYINNILYYRIKNKTLELLITDSSQESEDLIKKFVYENAGIISPTDLDEKRASEEAKVANITYNNVQWYQIRNEREQYLMLTIFAEKIANYLNLNEEESKALIQTIKLGLLSGFLTNENMVMENGQISEVIGLEYDSDRRKFIINQELRKNINKNKRIIYEDSTETKTLQDDNDVNLQNRRCLIKQWNKYLLELNSKKLKKVN